MSASNRRQHIFVSHHGGRAGAILDPVWRTVEAGFRHHLAGDVVVWHKTVTRSEDGRRRVAKLRRGDVYVWVGEQGADAQPWAELRSRGVTTVYYQTEPPNLPCGIDPRSDRLDPDEVWDFGHGNVQACQHYIDRRAAEQPNSHRMVARYVPPGYLPPPAATPGCFPGGCWRGDGRTTRQPQQPPHQLQQLQRQRQRQRQLLFLGYPHFRSGRGRCYAQLKEALGERLNATWDIWGPEATQRWWEARGKHAIHLHLHKHCGAKGQPPAFRLSPLLSRGAVVVSERCHRDDEAAYDGLVRFGTVAQLPTLFERAASRLAARAVGGGGSSSEGGVSDAGGDAGVGGAGDIDAAALQARRISRRFEARFAPSRLFERAGVYRMLREGRAHDNRLAIVAAAEAAHASLAGPLLTNSSSDSLSSSSSLLKLHTMPRRRGGEWRPGYCGETIGGLGDCSGSGAKGVLALTEPKAYDSWRNAVAACAARCAVCSRCRFVSLTLRMRDCSWFHECPGYHADGNLGRLEIYLPGFRTYTRQQLLRQAGLADDAAPSSSSPPPPPPPPPPVNEGAAAVVAARAVGYGGSPAAVAIPAFGAGAPLRGYCEETPEASDCSRGFFGSVRGIKDLAGCVAMCTGCARCRFVSYSQRNDDCSWFSWCRQPRTAAGPPTHAESYQTVAVLPATQHRASLAPAAASNGSKASPLSPSWSPSLDATQCEPSSPPGRARFALLLHGRIGTTLKAASKSEGQPADRRLIVMSALSHMRHVVCANTANAANAANAATPTAPGASAVDVFVHSWNPESAELIDAQYGAHLRSSRHQPVEHTANGRSQSLSLARAVELMLRAENGDGSYRLALALRHDIVLGSPFDLFSLNPSRLWLPSVCGGWWPDFATPATSRVEEAQVAAQCPGGALKVKDRAVHQLVLSRFRVDQMYGLRHIDNLHYGRPSLSERAALTSFQNDFWIAATPRVLASWSNISDAQSYDLYVRRLRARGITQQGTLAAHYLWPVHIQQVLGRAADVRYVFVHAVMARHAYPHLLAGGELAGWRVPNWRDNTLNCRRLRVHGGFPAVREFSLEVEAKRMWDDPRYGELAGDPLAAWLHGCPYAREPPACCDGTACWEQICSERELADHEEMRGFAVVASWLGSGSGSG